MSHVSHESQGNRQNHNPKVSTLLLLAAVATYGIHSVAESDTKTTDPSSQKSSVPAVALLSNLELSRGAAILDYRAAAGVSCNPKNRNNPLNPPLNSLSEWPDLSVPADHYLSPEGNSLVFMGVNVTAPTQGYYYLKDGYALAYNQKAANYLLYIFSVKQTGSEKVFTSSGGSASMPIGTVEGKQIATISRQRLRQGIIYDDGQINLVAEYVTQPEPEVYLNGACSQAASIVV